VRLLEEELFQQGERIKMKKEENKTM